MGCCCGIKSQKNNEQQHEIETNQIPKVEQEQNKIIQVDQEQIKKEKINITPEKVIIQTIKQCDANQIIPIEEEKKKYLMLLGAAGVGKSTLFNQLQLQDDPNETTSFISNYKEGKLNEYYYFIDTPSFQMDDDIETREKFIKEFQEYFDNRKIISSFGIVVNFERTDLMKKKVLSALKYLRKFIKIISIIIVNMELSDDENKDKEHLRNSFKFMGSNQIIFINKNMNQQEILEQIKQITFYETQIDLTDTIFEKITKSLEERQLKDLQLRLEQRI